MRVMTAENRNVGIDGLFERLSRQGEMALMPFLTCGYPDLESTKALAHALEKAGADALELGVPFSDPVADGPTIQRTSQSALASGVTLGVALQVLRELRREGLRLPVLLMSYYNVFLAYGLAEVASAVASAGGQGLIVPDLPFEESGPLERALRDRELDLIRFLAPTSSEERARQVSCNACGFIYCVALTGVTGARRQLSEDLPGWLRRTKEIANVPLVVGFGISHPDHVRALSGLADGVIVASALVDLMDRASNPTDRVDAVQAFVAELKAATRRPVYRPNIDPLPEGRGDG